jgi:hypothetical protein
MTYKETVDDILIQFKVHNESIRAQNPYWILYRLVSEINSLRDELLVKIPDRYSIPEWMIVTSDKLIASVTNSGSISGVYDDFKFGEYKLPQRFHIFENRGIIEAIASMRQKEIFIEDVNMIMMRIKAEDENLKYYSYAYLTESTLMIYPYVESIYVRYIPKIFCANYSSIDTSDDIPVPTLFVNEARKRILESVMLQKQLPDDDWNDQRDGAERDAAQSRKQV